MRAGEAKLRGRARGIHSAVAKGPPTQMLRTRCLSSGGPHCPVGCAPLSRRCPDDDDDDVDVDDDDDEMMR